MTLMEDLQYLVEKGPGRVAIVTTSATWSAVIAPGLSDIAENTKREVVYRHLDFMTVGGCRFFLIRLTACLEIGVFDVVYFDTDCLSRDSASKFLLRAERAVFFSSLEAFKRLTSPDEVAMLESWCKANEYTELEWLNGAWWAFPPGAVMKEQVIV